MSPRLLAALIARRFREAGCEGHTIANRKEKVMADEVAQGRGNGTMNLIAILLAIVFGGLVGVFYGRTMWIASDGPQQAIARLERVIAQKTSQAQQQENLASQSDSASRREQHLAEAERLRGQIPTIQEEIGRLKEIRDQAAQQRSARELAIASLSGKLIDFVGDLFLQTLKLLVIPLVVTTMVCAITSLGDIRKFGRLGGWTISYFLSTTAVAVLLGLILVSIIRPGQTADDTFAYVSENVTAQEGVSAFDTLLNVFRGREGHPGSGMFPENLILAAAETNVLALIIFSLAFGGALTTLGERGEPAIRFFDAANEAIMKIVHLVILVAPIGIFGLVASNFARHGGAEGFGDELMRLGRYVFTVLLGLAVHFVFLCTILAILARRNPLVYFYNGLRALLTAMSTASSSATLPVTLECTENHNKVSRRVANFVLPLGATINMDGTALYEAVAAVFIAQTTGIDLSIGQLVVVFLTATLAAIGAAGIPEAGLVTMVIVLTAVGLPVQGIGTLLAVDWFLDRMRTTVNVFGDTIGAGILDALLPDHRPAAAEPLPG